jgi:hypothetical protein
MSTLHWVWPSRLNARPYGRCPHQEFPIHGLTSKRAVKTRCGATTRAYHAAPPVGALCHSRPLDLIRQVYTPLRVYQRCIDRPGLATLLACSPT